MYCCLGLCKALAEKVIQPNGGLVEECDFDLFCSPFSQNDNVDNFAVGFFMPDGKTFVIDKVFRHATSATRYVHFLNGGEE